MVIKVKNNNVWETIPCIIGGGEIIEYKSENIFNPSWLEFTGYYYSIEDGETHVSTTVRKITVDKIPISKKNILIKQNGLNDNSKVMVVYFYNGDTFIKTISTPLDTIYNTEWNIEMPSGANCIRIMTNGSITGENISITYNPTTEFVPYLLKTYVKQETIPTEGVKSSIYGKQVINFGDSIFGKRRPPYDISTCIQNITGATVYNCGFGGLTAGTHYSQYYDPFALHSLADSIYSENWSVQDAAIIAGEGVIPDYFADTINLLKSTDFSKIDIITIAYGTNDWNFNVTMDNPSNTKDVNTFCGALRYSIEKILSKYNHIKIFLCTPIFRYILDGNNEVIDDSDTNTNAGGNKLTDFLAKVKEVSKEYHLPCIDNYYGLGFNRLNRLYYFKNNDGTHPIYTGCKLIAENMAHALEGDYTAQPVDTKLDQNKVKTTTNTTSGNVYDVTYINTMLGDVESLLGGI